MDEPFKAVVFFEKPVDNKVSCPLVSVGVPAYNRPSGLKRTLECITSQTYSNLEIIVSDNASPDPEVENIARGFASKDKRISFYRQEINQGPAFNFKFVLKQAQGKYFMWAADDDEWESFYIEKLVGELENLGADFVAANFEAQYMDENSTRYDFFPEGVPFYNFQSNAALDRIKHVLSHNYGNLIYSLYRKEILDQQQMIFAENEIPFLLQVAKKGNWRVLPDVGFLKRTSLPTYRQARWEMTGGIIPQSSRVSLRSIKGLTGYHREALDNINNAIGTLNIREKERGTLKSLARNLIWKHWFWLIIGYKPRNF